ncbi:hypothetical protein BpHYR1_018288 [Brachionus plicatilis]|uniref:Uncharacterized protein n=1 Tax=Brachionus plicatilis TaxID=10195 RepID=A0A3M7PA07_BRAPC|nr:hypothetical protein BpHYR1_018288 [Brachionus plicatilis]
MIRSHEEANVSKLCKKKNTYVGISICNPNQTNQYTSLFLLVKKSFFYLDLSLSVYAMKNKNHKRKFHLYLFGSIIKKLVWCMEKKTSELWIRAICLNKKNKVYLRKPLKRSQFRFLY